MVLVQTVIVDNRAGASGNIGAELVAKSSPQDGYTLLVAGAPHAINVSLFQNLRYDLAKDLAPISNIATFPSVIALHPSLPARSVKELIALAKSRPGQINFGSAGNGSPNHPKELVRRLNNDVVASLEGADVKERLASLGAEPAPMFLESFGRHVREEIAKWTKVVKESGAKVD